MNEAKHWTRFLPLAQFWYNTCKHSSLGISPFEALFGRKPSLGNTYIAGSSCNNTIDTTLSHRTTILHNIKASLQKAQQRMINQANKHRSDIEFNEGDRVYLKLRSYRQISVRKSDSHKLAPRYYGPFTILRRVGSVAYELELPKESRIHPVFHVSLLRPCLGSPPPLIAPLPHLGQTGEMFTKPSDVLDRRLILRDGVPIPQLLVSWFGASIEEALWVDEIDFTLTYPDFRYEGRSERREPHPASPTEESRTDDEAEVKKWTTEIKHWKDDAEGSDVGSVSKGEESQTNEAAEVSKWTAEKENREEDEERFGSPAWRVAAETNSQGADRVSHNSAPHPFIEPLESSVKLTSVGLEDKAFPQGVGIDKAHSSYGPTAVNKPVRLKSAPAWAADFV
ncbi:hypothetical protein OROGR_019233 [Orobanche gracilis]